MSDYGVVSTINPPTLLNVRQDTLIKFDNDYTKYVDKIRQVNQGRPTNNKIVPSSIRQCLDGTLLNTLCIIGKIEDAETMEDATDDAVEKWFRKHLSLAPEDLTERVRAALDSVQYFANPQDPGGSATDFIVDIVSALDRNNASEIVKDKESCKGLISRMINKLEPAELKERMREAKEIWSSAQKSDINFFEECLRKNAVQVNKGELVRARMNRRGQKRGNTSKISGKDSKAQKSTGSFEGNTQSKKEKKRNDATWKLPCLNKHCNEIHRVRYCPKTSDEQKKKLLEEYRANKKKRNGKTIGKLVCTSVVRSNPENDRFDILLHNSINAVAVGDTGSDVNAMDSRLLQTLQETNHTLPIKVLEKPISLNCAINTGKDIPFTASKRVEISITIFLPGSKLPLRVHKVPFIVVDQKMDETIIGRPFLKRIGFNLHDHLIRSQCRIDGKNFEDIDTEEVKLAALSYRGLQYNAVDDDPIVLPESVGALIGSDTEAEIKSATSKILDAAKANGISSEGHEKLRIMLQEYSEIMRVRPCADPPAKVAPLQIQLKQGARPYRATQRRYSPKQRQFLVDTVRKLEQVGAVYKNPQAKWASPALAVNKPGSEEFRFTVDLRIPNSYTIPIVSSLPHLESIMQLVEGSTCFAKVDMAHAYWQLPLAEESKEIMSIQTPLGVFSSNRLLQGSTDAGNHFQSVTSEAFIEISDNLLQWMDDFMIHDRSEQELLNKIEYFFKVCKQYGFKININKTQLFSNEAEFCGRIFTKNGFRFDDKKVSSLVAMSRPTKGHELQQFLCAINWMRNSVPEYSKITASLNSLLEHVYKLCSSRKKSAVKKLSLHGLWTEEHDMAFKSIKQQLARSTTMAFPKQYCQLCLFTDASDTHWAAVLTQIPQTEIGMDINDQKHEPLAFLSGAFTGSSSKWSVPEKEGFAVVESMCKLDYLLHGRHVVIYTDHANLVYLYDPVGQNPGVARHTACKLMRWALKLSAFRYVIEHVAGEKNVWADMLTRWGSCPKSSAHNTSVKSLLLAPITPSLDESLDWPSLADIQTAQAKNDVQPPKSFSRRDGTIQNQSGIIFVPKDEDKLKLRIMIAGHAGLSGHRGYKTTQRNIKNHFWWKNIDAEIKAFCLSCIHCLITHTGQLIPRPLGHTLHAEKPNEIIHFDFCYITPGENGFDYVLILKDDLSGFVRLVPATNANAETTADALIDWFSCFGTVKQWVSDRGSHFKNEVVRSLREKSNSSHHFTLAYTPWTNGTIEVVCRELLRTLRVLTSEFQLSLRSWRSVLPVVQSVLNNTPLTRLANRCPLTAFTGLPQDTPLTTISSKSKKNTMIKSIEEIRVKQIIQTESLMKSLQDMHRDIKLSSSKNREDAVIRHNSRTHVQPVNFYVGDFVLRAKTKRERGAKISARWCGPYRVIACKSDYLFTIEDIVTGLQEEAHGRRLKFFRNKNYEVKEDLLNHVAYQTSELMNVSKFLDLRKTKGTVEVLTKWKGLDSSEDSWENIEVMREDVPVLIEEFLKTIAANGTAKQKRMAKHLLN